MSMSVDSKTNAAILSNIDLVRNLTELESKTDQLSSKIEVDEARAWLGSIQARIACCETKISSNSMKGFEGELVRLSDQEPDLNRMENLLSEGHGISLLYIFSGLGESENHELQNFSFMGFDYAG